MLTTTCFPANFLQGLQTFYQCVKRELPYEAMHLYQKLKQTREGGFDLGMCNSLLNVAVGEAPTACAACVLNPHADFWLLCAEGLQQGGVVSCSSVSNVSR